MSSKKYYWNDEIFSWFFLADPSFSDMWSAFNDKINNTPALYFILGWVWEKAFGDAEVSLRLFSSLGFCGALVFTWLTLRKTYSHWAAIISVFLVFCTSRVIHIQNAEARMYGLYLFLVAISFFLYDRINRDSKPRRQDLLFLFLTLAALINTHIYGLLYSGALLGAQLLRDLWEKKWHPWIYGAIILSWFSFFIYYPAFIIQADVANPRGWVPYPLFSELIGNLSLADSTYISIRIVIIFIIPWVILGFFIGNFRFHSLKRLLAKTFEKHLHLLTFALAFLFVPVLAWILSYAIKPIFWDRYTLPTCLGWCILMAELIELLIFYPRKEIPGMKNRYRNLLMQLSRRYYPLLLITILVILPIRRALMVNEEKPPGFIESLYGYPELPIVVMYSGEFLRSFFYSADRDRYYFILDEETAATIEAGAYSLQEYKHFEAFRRHYPEFFKGHIIDSEEFLNNFPKFLVLGAPIPPLNCPEKPFGGKTKKDWWDNIQCPQWLEKRILSDPRFVTEEIEVNVDTTIFNLKKKLDNGVLVENTAFRK